MLGVGSLFRSFSAKQVWKIFLDFSICLSVQILSVYGRWFRLHWVPCAQQKTTVTYFCWKRAKGIQQRKFSWWHIQYVHMYHHIHKVHLIRTFQLFLIHLSIYLSILFAYSTLGNFSPYFCILSVIRVDIVIKDRLNIFILYWIPITFNIVQEFCSPVETENKGQTEKLSGIWEVRHLMFKLVHSMNFSRLY